MLHTSMVSKVSYDCVDNFNENFSFAMRHKLDKSGALGSCSSALLLDSESSWAGH